MCGGRGRGKGRGEGGGSINFLPDRNLNKAKRLVLFFVVQGEIKYHKVTKYCYTCLTITIPLITPTVFC
jgi:hypothetical protein